MGYQCFHCLSNSVCWDSDFSFEDFGYEGEGIVHICHCGNCGADIEYRISFSEGGSMTYIIKDILHSGSNGIRGSRKIGVKYDNCRGQIVESNLNQYKVGDNVEFYQDDIPLLNTSPLVSVREMADLIYVETTNSIYILDII